jgi:EAL domain-containing protein (putative c-di-GMP-specific phosphodiesterase class I)
VAIVDRHATTEEDAFVAADVALYEAKHSGRNRAVAYDPSGRQRERLTTGLVWSQRLRRALDDDGFVLHAQPIVDLATGRTTFYELLVRMRGPDGELIGPAAFLYCAERFGYIRRLDRWVVEEAARLAAAHPGATFSVNLSAKSVTDPAIGDHIEQAVSAAGCRAEQLIFEITETAAIANMEQARSLARRLARLGSRLGLDDFGSGFASFYHLKTLPLDILKIDGEFIRNLGRDRDDQLVVRAVQDVARGMGKVVVAEHVEDEEAAERLRDLGVGHGQGYHFARPGPVDEILAA